MDHLTREALLAFFEDLVAMLAGVPEEAAERKAKIDQAGRQRLAWTAELVLGLRLVFGEPEAVPIEVVQEAVH